MKGQKMVTSIDEQILRATKEIIVKFIEVGRVSPTGFGDSFKEVYNAIDNTVKSALKQEDAGEEQALIPEKKGKEGKNRKG